MSEKTYTMTAAEIGELQASEAELVAAPLRRRVAELEDRLRAVEALRDEWSRHHRILDGAGGGLVATMTHADVVRRLDAVLALSTSPAEQEGDPYAIPVDARPLGQRMRDAQPKMRGPL